MGGGYFWYLGPEHTNGVLNPGLINKHLAACLFFLQEWITRAAQLEVPFDIAESEDNVTEKSCDRIMNRNEYPHVSLPTLFTSTQHQYNFYETKARNWVGGSGKTLRIWIFDEHATCKEFDAIENRRL